MVQHRKRKNKRKHPILKWHFRRIADPYGDIRIGSTLAEGASHVSV